MLRTNVILAALILSARAESLWPQFRGPAGSSTASGAPLPAELDATSNLLWRASVPSGSSSPVIVGDRIFLTGCADGKLATFALKRGDGSVLWRHDLAPEKLEPFMEKLGSLGTKLESALGSIGTAINGDASNPGLFKKIDTLVSDNGGKISSTMTNLQSVTDKLNKGEGTLGKLINDSKIHDELVATVGEIKTAAAEAKTFMANAQTIIDQVKSGKGPLGALVFDEKVGADIRSVTQNLRDVSDKIARGEGTLGKLLTDDSLLKDTRAVLKKADRALDGFDDAGPITAVGVVARGLF